MDFKGYVDFFFLQDLVLDNYKKVDFWVGTGDMTKSPFPATVNEYLSLIKKELSFVQKRNDRIKQFFAK